MSLLLLLVACGGLTGKGGPAVLADTGVDVVVEHRGGNAEGDSSDGGSGSSGQSTVTCYTDLDLDGHGNGNSSAQYAGTTCPEGTAPIGDDWCDDQSNAWTYADCQEPVEDTDTGNDPDTDEPDADGDGSPDDEDCDDANNTIHPGAIEDPAGDGYGDGRDNDCDGQVDEGTERADDDADGYAEVHGDCDDGNPAINPAADEIDDNGVDDNCDGQVDVPGQFCCPDVDSDGYGASSGCAWEEDGVCASGYVPGDGDCNDRNSTVGPAQDDPYGNDLDEDCDGYDG